MPTVSPALSKPTHGSFGSSRLLNPGVAAVVVAHADAVVPDGALCVCVPAPAQ